MTAMFSGCGTSPSSNNSAVGSGKQQSEENIETTFSNGTEDSENMDSNAPAKNFMAQKEQVENFRPEIAGTVENIDQYDIILFGFSNWLAYHNLIQCTQG